MTNLIRGTLSEASTYTRQNWRGLLNVSIIPLGLLILFTLGYILMMVPFFTKTFALLASAEMSNGQPDLEAIQQATSGMMFFQMLGLAASLVSMFISAYACVRVVRYYVRGETGLWRMDKEIATASLMWALYSLGIYMLAVAAMIGFMVILGLVGGIFAGIVSAVGKNTLVAALGVLALLAGMIMAFFVPAGVAMRFASGMPVVALGETPDFFSEMWKQSRGYTVALTWRFIFIYLVMTLALSFVVMIFFIGPAMEVISMAASGNLKDDPSALFALLKGLTPRLLLAEAAAMVVFVPFFWFGTIWLTMVNRRLYDAFKQTATAPATS